MRDLILFIFSERLVYADGRALVSEGVNHADKVPVDGMKAVDGLIAVFTVTITEDPTK